MSLLDRFIIKRFIANFAILFLLIYILATSIDIILQLDEFVQVIKQLHGDTLGFSATLWQLLKLAVDLHWPRFFQLYAYLLGAVSVGAMGFTLAQMHRHRELVAILASGMGLYRIAWPIIVAAFLLNMLHLMNSNLILPQLAPLLIRTYTDLEQGGAATFAVPFTEDGEGTLLQSPAFHRDTQMLEFPTILERDEHGRTMRRITADRAVWNDDAGEWDLTNGMAVNRVVDREDASDDEDEAERADRMMQRTDVAVFRTDLTPRALIVKRYAAFAQMLSPAQIDELLASPGAVDKAALARIKFGRYSIVLTNLLMLLLTLPFFLLREPANLLRQSIWCAGVALSIMLGGFVGMEVELPGIPPVAAVFLPVAILIPLTLFSAGFIKT